jgi:hypothetical protein
MPDYIIFDSNGKIVDKLISVDPSVVEGKANVLEVSREAALAATKFHKVEGGVLVEMAQVEKDSLLAAEAVAIEQKEDAAVSTVDDLLLEGLAKIKLLKTDAEIDKIQEIDDVQIFLKKLCRYIAVHSIDR